MGRVLPWPCASALEHCMRFVEKRPAGGTGISDEFLKTSGLVYGGDAGEPFYRALIYWGGQPMGERTGRDGRPVGVWGRPFSRSVRGAI